MHRLPCGAPFCHQNGTRPTRHANTFSSDTFFYGCVVHTHNRWEWAHIFRWSILIKWSPRLLVGLSDMIMAVALLRVWFDKMFRFTAWITGSLRMLLFFPFSVLTIFLCTESYWSNGASLLPNILCFSSIQNDKSKNGLKQSPASCSKKHKWDYDEFERMLTTPGDENPLGQQQLNDKRVNLAKELFSGITYKFKWHFFHKNPTEGFDCANKFAQVLHSFHSFNKNVQN